MSAKTGLNVDAVLAAVVARVEPPRGDGSASARLRVLLLDCHYDPYRGAVSVVQVVDGRVAVGDKVSSFATGQSSEVLELGLMTPEPLRVNELRAGKEGGMAGGREGGSGFFKKPSSFFKFFFAFLGEFFLNLDTQRRRSFPPFGSGKCFVFVSLLRRLFPSPRARTRQLCVLTRHSRAGRGIRGFFVIFWSLCADHWCFVT